MNRFLLAGGAGPFLRALCSVDAPVAPPAAAGGGAPPAAAPVAAPAPIAPAAPVAPAPAPGEDFKAMSPEQFKARLERERGAGSTGLLGELGFKDKAEADAWLKAKRADDEAKKTELQRAQEAAAKVEPLSKRADSLEAAIKNYLAAEEKAVPDDKKGLLDLAPPATQPQDRLDWIVKAKEKGMFGTAAAPPPPTAAQTRAGGSPPPPPGNQAKDPRTMTPEEYARWEKERIAHHAAAAAQRR